MADAIENLLSMFQCCICYESLSNPHMCPKCSKMFCFECIEKWIFTEDNERCPHCREYLLMDELVKFRWGSEVYEQVSLLNRSYSRGDEKCDVHSENFNIYCVTCGECICHECALFTKLHSDHSLLQLSEEFGNRLDQFRIYFNKLGKHQIKLSAEFKKMGKNYERLKADCAAHLKDVDKIASEWKEVIREKHYKPCEQAVLDQISSRIPEMYEMEKIFKFLQDIIQNQKKVPLIQQSDHIREKIDEIIKVPVIKHTKISCDFKSELVPPFETRTVVVKNFRKMRIKNKVLYSAPLHLHGLTWRLVVYPNGKGKEAKNKYLSVFLQAEGDSQFHKHLVYDYRIYLCGGKNCKNSNVSFGSVATFHLGKLRGLKRFHKLNLLSPLGFLRNNDSLKLKFSLRSPTFFEKARQQSEQINKLQIMLANSEKTRQQGEHSLQQILLEDHNRKKAQDSSDSSETEICIERKILHSAAHINSSIHKKTEDSVCSGVTTTSSNVKKTFSKTSSAVRLKPKLIKIRKMKKRLSKRN